MVRSRLDVVHLDADDHAQAPRTGYRDAFTLAVGKRHAGQGIDEQLEITASQDRHDRPAVGAGHRPGLFEPEPLIERGRRDYIHGSKSYPEGLANTPSQIGGSIGLAVLATAAGARAAMEAGESSPATALAAGYDLVFLMAAGLGLAIAVVSLMLPRHRRG
jgi:hypothetical protein